MFVTVSKNFVKVLVWYFLFVTAFALSFYFLFHMPNDDGVSKHIILISYVKNSFKTSHRSILPLQVWRDQL